MKVAITIFRNGVSPRIDIADSLMIYDIDNDIVKKQEKCSFSFEQPAELVSFLQKKEIEKIICGGCPQFYLRALTFYGFDVLRGCSGDPEHIIKLLTDGSLPGLPVNKACNRQRRGRRQSRQVSGNWSDFVDTIPGRRGRGKSEKKI